ncbi:MAG: phosphoethanolamine transferase [Alphaproteobacteria bacterium]|nr:phosphoethanolamine transferase [Alphaproteobacteria bacterium]
METTINNIKDFFLNYDFNLALKSLETLWPTFVYIAVIAYLPLIYATLKSLSFQKIKNKVFLVLLFKDFIRTLPICWLMTIPVVLFPNYAKHYLYFIQLVFAPLMFMELGHIHLYGVRIGINTFYSLFVTNLKETKEFFKQAIPTFLYFVFLVFWLGPYYLINNMQLPEIKCPKIKYTIAIVLFIFGYSFIKNLFKKWPKFKDAYLLNPYSNLIYHYFKFKTNYKLLQEMIAEHTTQPFDEIKSKLSSDTKQTYVIVIGESANRNHFSLYGYERKTNEFMEKFSDNLLVLPGLKSIFAQTIPSLEKTITFSDEEHPDLIFTKGSIIDYFNQAGFKTYWLSNQYALDDTAITAMTTKASYNKCFNFSGMKRFERSGLDGEMLPDIEKIIANEDDKKVIFIHLIGSHAAYINRYPTEFTHFQGDVKGKEGLTDAFKQQLNTYDDAIRYTDFVLSKITEALNQKDGANYLLYFSDHGEDVFDSRQDRLLSHSELANEPMTSVPCLLWLSSKLNELRPDIKERSKNPKTTSTLEDLIHLIIDISSLENNDFDSTKSLLNK